MSDPYTRKPATADYALREGDTGPAIEATLLHLDGTNVDLSNASEVRMYIRDQSSDDVVVNTAVTIDDAANGDVSHEFADGFASTGTGMHELYFRVEYSDGSIETYPRAKTAYLWVPEHFGSEELADVDAADATVGQLTVERDVDMQGGAIQNAGSISTEDLGIKGGKVVSHNQNNIVRDDGEVFTFGSEGEYSDFGEAVNAAIESGATIFLPETYGNFGTQIDIDLADSQDGGVTLRGQGILSTLPTYTGSGAAVKVTDTWHVTLRDFGVLGDGSAGQKGLYLYADTTENINGFHARNLGFAGFGSYAIHEDENNGNIFGLSYDRIHVNDIGDHAYYSPDPVPQKTLSNWHTFKTDTIAQVRPDGYSNQFSGEIQGDFVNDSSTNNATYYNLTSHPGVTGTGFNITGDFFIVFGCHAENNDTGYSFTFARNFSVMACDAAQMDSYGFEFISEIDGVHIQGIEAEGSTNDIRFVQQSDQTFRGIALGAYNAVNSSVSGLELVGVTHQNPRFGRSSRKASDYTTHEEDAFIGARSSEAAITITLSNDSAYDGSRIEIADVDNNAGTNNITIETEGSQNINGSSTQTIDTNRGSYTLRFQNNNWYIVSER